jgi:hypothetical protein
MHVDCIVYCMRNVSRGSGLQCPIGLHWLQHSMWRSWQIELLRKADQHNCHCIRHVQMHDSRQARAHGFMQNKAWAHS